MTRYTAVLLGAWLAVGMADAHSAGTYDSLSLALMLVAALAVMAPVLVPDRYAAQAPRGQAIGVGLVAVAVLRPLERTWSYVTGAHLALPRLIVLVTALVVAGLWWLGRRAWTLPIAAAGVTVAGTLLIAASRRPHIDVWFMLQDATDGLRHGANMYTQHWSGSPGITDQFPYLPMTAVVLAPFRLVFGDVRYGLLAATVVSAFFVSRLAPRALGGGLGALVLMMPGLLFLVEASWTEPLVLMYLTGAVFAISRCRLGWAVVAIAIAVATKQHVWLLLPLFAAWPAFGWKRTTVATVLGAAFCLPWLVANPHAFWSDAISYNLHLAPRWDSLDLFSLAVRLGWAPPFWLVGLLTLAAIAVAVRIARTPSGLLLASAAVLCVFNLLNKQTFFNEWWLVTSLLVTALAAAAARESVVETSAVPRSRMVPVGAP